MIPTARLLPLLLLPALLAGCGSEKADGTGPGGRTASAAGSEDSSDSGAAGPSEGAAGSGAAASAVPSRSELDARMTALGVAPELVYVTRAPGFTLAQQSVGVNGDDGFSASYWSATGGVLHLYVDRGTLTTARCERQPVDGASGTGTTCGRDGALWYRTTGDRYEYAVPGKDHVVWIAGDKAPRTVLRAAALAVHRPSAAELTALVPTAPASAEPVERGDLPSTGDGAPDNSVGVGG